MKLVGKLKEKVEKAETKEQAKEIIAHAGMELTDDEMSMVSGGEFTPTQHKFLNGDNQVVTDGNPVIYRLEGVETNYKGYYEEIEGRIVPKS